MEDIYNELEEILSKDNYDQFADDYREQQETANRLLANFANDEKSRKQIHAMKELSNLFITAINYNHAIRRKHVDVSKQMLEKDFCGADELSAELESSAMLLVARAWLRSKLTYLQVSGPLWFKICSLIGFQIPLISGSGGAVSDGADDHLEDGVVPELKSLATSIYRYLGTYGSGLSLDLELQTQEELVKELTEINRSSDGNDNNDGDNDDGKAAERMLAEFDDVIDDAFDYDRLRSRPLVSTLSQSLVSPNSRILQFSLKNLVPLASKQVVEQWLLEYVDSSLLKQIHESQTLQPINLESEDSKPVNLHDIERSRKLFLQTMGLPCEDGCEDEQ